MLQYILSFLASVGIVGLVISMAIEGASIPFPGIILVITYGYILDPSMYEIIWIAFIMSITYSLLSYIPYLIGRRLEVKIKRIFKERMVKAQDFMVKYGDVSVALTRPFGIGNYISYVAGIGKVKPWRYGILTFLGIYPWSFVMILLGKVYKGNNRVIMELLKDYAGYVYGGGALIAIVYIGIHLLRRKASSKS